MTAIPIKAYKRRPKFEEMSDDEAKKLIRLIKMSSDNNGILIMKSLRNSIKKALTERRKRPSFQRVQYSWDKPHLPRLKTIN